MQLLTHNACYEGLVCVIDSPVSVRENYLFYQVFSNDFDIIFLYEANLFNKEHERRVYDKVMRSGKWHVTEALLSENECLDDYIEDILDEYYDSVVSLKGSSTSRDFLYDVGDLERFFIDISPEVYFVDVNFEITTILRILSYLKGAGSDIHTNHLLLLRDSLLTSGLTPCWIKDLLNNYISSNHDTIYGLLDVLLSKDDEEPCELRDSDYEFFSLFTKHLKPTHLIRKSFVGINGDLDLLW